MPDVKKPYLTFTKCRINIRSLWTKLNSSDGLHNTNFINNSLQNLRPSGRLLNRTDFYRNFQNIFVIVVGTGAFQTWLLSKIPREECSLRKSSNFLLILYLYFKFKSIVKSKFCMRIATQVQPAFLFTNSTAVQKRNAKFLWNPILSFADEQKVRSKRTSTAVAFALILYASCRGHKTPLECKPEKQFYSMKNCRSEIHLHAWL